MTIVVPSLFSDCSSSMTSCPCTESRFPVGSSARISGWSPTTARATATRCCWPPDNCPGMWLARCAIPMRSMTSATRRLRSADGMLWYSRASSIFSATVSSSIRLKLWKIKPMFCLRIELRCDSEYGATSSSKNQYWPSDGLSSMPMTFSNVDLPQPDGPMIATKSPCAISRLTPFSATVSTSSVR